MNDPTAAPAAREAAQRAAAVSTRWERINRMADTLAEIRQRNHLAGRIRAAFEGEETP